MLAGVSGLFPTHLNLSGTIPGWWGTWHAYNFSDHSGGVDGGSCKRCEPMARLQDIAQNSKGRRGRGAPFQLVHEIPRPSLLVLRSARHVGEYHPSTRSWTNPLSQSEPSEGSWSAARPPRRVITKALMLCCRYTDCAACSRGGKSPSPGTSMRHANGEREAQGGRRMGRIAGGGGGLWHSLAMLAPPRVRACPG